MTVKFELRDMTKEEYKRETVAFEEHAMEFGNPKEEEERLGYVATDEGKFIGVSSGLAYKVEGKYGNYFYISDLLVEKEYRKNGHGKKLLGLLEAKVKELGIKNIWTWTASYEAETFYIKQGYKVFTRFENYYKSGHARVGLIKEIA